MVFALKGFALLFLFVSLANLFNYCESFTARKSTKCPGLYCGRTKIENGTFSRCGPCPRGSRPDNQSICQTCDDEPEFYDWLYLAFMALLSPMLHSFFIDFTNNGKGARLTILHASAFFESLVAAFCSLLILPPAGSFKIKSCSVQQLSDWYTMLYNPRPGHTAFLHCTQEIVYPLYTLIIIYYAFGLVFMMMIRPWLSAKFLHHRGTKSIYAALYFFPILVIIQAIFAGVIYYFFPYIVMGFSLISGATHFSYYSVQDAAYIVKETLQNPRQLAILIVHWILHAFSIIAITELEKPMIHSLLLLLVPLPSVFYIITVRYTDPDNLEPQ